MGITKDTWIWNDQPMNDFRGHQMKALEWEIELRRLEKAATPGIWGGTPKRLKFAGQEGPLMSYLVGDISSPEGMKVSLGSERIADHEFVAALVNSWRGGKLKVKE